MPAYYVLEQGPTWRRARYVGYVYADTAADARRAAYPQLRVRSNHLVYVKRDRLRMLAQRGRWVPLMNPRVL